MELRNRVALVTGASRGIGRAIAVALAREGVRLALNATSDDSLAAALAEVRGHGAEAVGFPADLGRTAQAEGLVRRALERFGTLHILVNNAGIGAYGPLESFATETYDHIMAVNARAPFILCREAIPYLRAAGGGTIVNIASVVAIKGYKEQAAYAASKHALLGMSKALVRELVDSGIRVHTLCPGGVATDLVRQARPDLDSDVLMRPEEIADIVLFLLSREGNAVIDRIDVRRQTAEPWD